MRRREFIAGLGSAAAWPIAARAQQSDRIRRVGVLTGLAADNPAAQSSIAAFTHRLQELGWTAGRNLHIDYRWAAGDMSRMRSAAIELVRARADVILVGGSPSLTAAQEATRTIPIVFFNVADPVGQGFVTSLARPGGNATGFTNFEFALGGKWLELLRDLAPRTAQLALQIKPGDVAARPIEAGNEAELDRIGDSGREDDRNGRGRRLGRERRRVAARRHDYRHLPA